MKQMKKILGGILVSMKFKINDEVFYVQDLSNYCLGILKHKGKVVDYSKGTDKAFGEYMVSFYHEKLASQQRCVVREADLIFDVSSRIRKLNKILKN